MPTATVTLTQNVPLEHLQDGPPGPDHNDALDLGLLSLQRVTITDGDGDQDSAQVGIGAGRLVFLDDGPDAQVDGEASYSINWCSHETTPPGTEEPTAIPTRRASRDAANFATISSRRSILAPTDLARSPTLADPRSADGIGSGPLRNRLRATSARATETQRPGRGDHAQSQWCGHADHRFGRVAMTTSPSRSIRSRVSSLSPSSTRSGTLIPAAATMIRRR